MRYLPNRARARIALGLVARGADISDRVVDLPVPEQEAADHAVARQEVIVREQGGMRRIGHGAKEGAPDLGRNLALDLEVLGLPIRSAPARSRAVNWGVSGKAVMFSPIKSRNCRHGRGQPS